MRLTEQEVSKWLTEVWIPKSDDTKRHGPVYKVLRDYLKKRGNWKNKIRGGSFVCKSGQRLGAK